MTNTLIHSASADKVSHMTGVRVAITHDKDQAQDQVDLFAGLGAEIYYYPCIEIIPYEDKDLESAVREAAAGKYDWLVLNDADTAWVVGDAMRAAGIDPNQIPRRLKVATIGCMTEIYAKEFLGLESSFAPEVYTPEFVAEELHLKPGDRVLLPQSSTTRAGLAKCLRNTGAEVTAAYRATYPLNAEVMKKIRRTETDRIRIAWSKGYDDYEIQQVDLLMRQAACLSGK